MRTALKGALGFLFVLLMLPISLPTRILSREERPSAMFIFMSQLVSLVPGIVGIFARRGFYRVALADCASDVSIEFGTIFASRGVSIGRGSYIGPNCTLGLVSIGEDVLIGSNVDLIGSPRFHDFERLDVPIKHQGGQARRLSVGNASWVGNSTVILADVGVECIIGAGSVLSRPAEDWGIYTGNPATKQRDRRDPRS